MSYRYSTLDVIVGVGMCAIVFGALLFVVATSGTFLAAMPEPVSIEQLSGAAAGLALLQPVLGQAIVERTLLQRHTDQITAAATSEWNQAMQAHRSLQAGPDGPFGFIMARAASLPIDHAARVQAVVGRAIVNFTKRGVRNGILSAEYNQSSYNNNMIGAAETMGQRLDRNFVSTWQPALGRWIVDASREHMSRVAGVQEQLGVAILHMAQAKSMLEGAWEVNQYQLGSLVAAIDRSGAMPDRAVVVAQAQVTEKGRSAISAGFVSSVEVPVGYLIVAVLALFSIFWGGLALSAAGREAKALAEARRNASRWVYRMAA